MVDLLRSSLMQLPDDEIDLTFDEYRFKAYRRDLWVQPTFSMVDVRTTALNTFVLGSLVKEGPPTKPLWRTLRPWPSLRSRG